MQKITVLITLILGSLLLVSCQTSRNDEEYFKSIVISKYYEALQMNDSVIEIYNNGESNIDLKGLYLDIYPNGDANYEYRIPLTGTIKASEYYVVARPDARQSILDKADHLTQDLLFNGNDMITLSIEEQILDAVGFYLSSTDFGRDATLIRLPEPIKQNRVYDEGDFILYQPEVFEYLKNQDFPIKTVSQLLNGPDFDPSLLDKPFLNAEDPTIGGGGVIKVTVSSTVDGDTTNFFREDTNEVIRVRYLYVDTPEVSGTHTTEQAWGVQASNFNKLYLLANHQQKTIYLQTIEGLSTVDTFGRFLALVWVDGVLSNHVIVRNGLSQVAKDFSKESMSAAVSQVPYISFLLAAQANAADKNLGVMGGFDANWDYGTNKPIFNPQVLYPNDLDWKS